VLAAAGLALVITGRTRARTAEQPVHQA
jgi:hypothetical protein